MSDELTNVASKALESVTDLLHRMMGPLADEIGESLGVWARRHRYKLALKMFQETQQMLKDAGITPKAVPPRLFVPILENASIEDDEELQSDWAALLANAAANASSVHPSFIEILRQLTPEDAQLLDKLYDSCVSKGTRRVTPWVDTAYVKRERRVEAGENPIEPFQNLIRLGLIQDEYEIDDRPRAVDLKHTRFGSAKVPPSKLKSHDELTEFAMRFVLACRPPKKPSEA